MCALTSDPTAILDVMASDRAYEATELQALFPNSRRDTFREAMHALWLKRLVERIGSTGWRRQQSTCVTECAPDSQSCATCGLSRTCAQCVREPAVAPVPLANLFDESDFSSMFK